MSTSLVYLVHATFRKTGLLGLLGTKRARVVVNFASPSKEEDAVDQLYRVARSEGFIVVSVDAVQRLGGNDLAWVIHS